MQRAGCQHALQNQQQLYNMAGLHTSPSSCLYTLPAYASLNATLAMLVQDPAMLDHSATKGSKVGRSHWMDMFVLRGSPQVLQKYNAAQPLQVIGGVSHEEWCALSCGVPIPPKHTAVGGVNHHEGHPHAAKYRVDSPSSRTWPIRPPSKKDYNNTFGEKRFARTLNHSCCSAHLPVMDRPFMIMTWLQQHLVLRQQEGGLNMPAPIVTRIYQVGLGLVLWPLAGLGYEWLLQNLLCFSVLCMHCSMSVCLMTSNCKQVLKAQTVGCHSIVQCSGASSQQCLHACCFTLDVQMQQSLHLVKDCCCHV